MLSENLALTPYGRWRAGVQSSALLPIAFLSLIQELSRGGGWEVGLNLGSTNARPRLEESEPKERGLSTPDPGLNFSRPTL